MTEGDSPQKQSGSVYWLIEDNETFRRTLARGLKRKMPEADFEEFGSIEQAVGEVNSRRVPSLILLDVGLPGMDGIAGMGWLRESFPDVVILILTAFEDDSKILAAIAAGARGYLLKTAPIGKIVEAIAEVHEGGAPLTPRVARRLLEHFTKPKAKVAEEESYDLKEIERTVLGLIVEGLLKKEIADRMGVGIHTVDTQMRSIYRKLQVSTRAAAVAKTLQKRILG
jgi:DNA-binding NarL/FixJ family response regulator